MRAIIFLLIALTAAGTALFIVVTVFRSYEEKIAEAQMLENTSYVIVAYSDLYQGVSITEDDLFAVEIPSDYLYKGGGAESHLFSSPEHVVGRTPKERILANEYIREERLADKNKGVGLNALIPRGMRAISVQISGGPALRGFLEPNNYVDLLVSFTPFGADIPETHYLLQAVYVIAVDDRLRPGADKRDIESRKRRRRNISGAVTLAVTPSQAEEIAHAVAQGKLTLALRNDLDIETQSAEGGVTMKDILNEQDEIKSKTKRRRKVKPVDKGHQLLIVNGSRKTDWKYNSNGEGLRN